MFTSRPVGIAVGVVAAATVLLTGCSSAAEESGTAAPAAGPVSVLSGTPEKACASLATQVVSASSPLVPIIVDRTGSVRDLDLSPDLAPVLKKIQSTGAAIQTIGVNGPGATPLPGNPIALDPAPGNSSRNADVKRQAALGCVRDWLHSPTTLPVGNNTDLLAAFSTAVRQNPAHIVVISDGINSTTELNLAIPPADPVSVAEQIRLSGSWTAVPNSVSVDWFNLGETHPPLTEAHRRAVTAFWTALLPNMHLHTRTGTATAGS